jgi:2-(3-amino-3-carboxypropyl)histidine synthase
LGDGRFHLESIMISNPKIAAYRYDPYSKILSREYYNIDEMFKIRKEAVKTSMSAKKVGIILGTLGRQGNLGILKRLQNLCENNKIEYFIILLSEIFPSKLELFTEIDVWIQIACPRLSIDWGYSFSKPLLNSYEAEVFLKSTEWKEIYPMDYYSKTGGSWSVSYK